MPHNHSLFRTATDNPEDQSTYLVYADWLEENGEPERAELMRVQCELERGVDDGPRLIALTGREQELIKAHGARWLGPLAEYQSSTPFSRGLAHLYLTAGKFVTKAFQKLGAEWFPQAGVADVMVTEETKRLGDLFASPLLGQIGHLSLVRTIDAAGLRLLAGSPGLSALRSLYASAPRMTRFTGKDPISAPYLGQLRSLGLTNFRATFNHVQELATDSEMPCLTELRLDDIGGVWTEGELRSLRPGPDWTRLKRLTLGGVLLTAEALGLLLREGVLAGAAELTLSSTHIRDEGCQALAATPLPSLRKLSLPTNLITGAGAARLISSAALPCLTELNLWNNSLGNSVAELALCPEAARLTTLELGSNNIGAGGVQALAASPHLSGLRRLSLASNPLVGDAGVEAIATGNLTGLRELDLGWMGQTVGERGVRALAASTRLPRLTRLKIQGVGQRRGTQGPLRHVLEEALGHRVLLDL